MSQTLLICFQPSDAAPLSGFASQLGAPYDVLLLTGERISDCGAGTVLTANLPELPPADALAGGIAEIASSYSRVAAVSSMQSKDLMPRIAGILDAGMVTDVAAVEAPNRFRRPIVAGTMFATVETLSDPAAFTVRPASFSGAGGGNGAARSVSLAMSGATKRTAVHAGGGSRPDLSQAKVVVSGGRPLKDAETFERVIGGLADRLGGAVGATRAAVDSGIAPNECQVGQTGKVVAPDLYIAAGISGSTQHMAGIKDSKIIVAINKDPDAPIFEFADIGIVGDLFDVIPELMQKLEK